MAVPYGKLGYYFVPGETQKKKRPKERKTLGL